MQYWIAFPLRKLLVDSLSDACGDLRLPERIHQGGTAPPISVLSAQRLTFRLQVEGGRWRN
ncbi:hypothetical protein N0Y54_42530 [Nostoc punctiforme UO1]|uniref:hypothetical protein n=1 Tax=Nostoc punctiforme TaxID=272131 RepID=UPI0030A98021